MTTNRTSNTQREAIKQFLKDGYSLSPLEALGLFGAYRLAAHIEVLRKRGMPIVTKMQKDVTGRTYARYSSPTGALERIDAMCQTKHSPLNKQKEIAYHAN